MVKFAVVLYRRPDLSIERFRAVVKGDHARVAQELPGLARYVQNHVVVDASRRHLGWDAVIELWWNGRGEMEAAWQSSAGRRATEHLAEFADLSRSTWSIVEKHILR
jgi:uncharacterized protein (TIGR02118 family)